MVNIVKQSVVFSVIAAAFLVSTAPAEAQSSVIKPKTDKQERKVLQTPDSEQPAAPGTYQILAKDAASHEAFPVDILLEIERNRDEKKVVFIKAGHSSLIKILPYSTIRSKDFEPVPEFGVQH